MCAGCTRIRQMKPYSNLGSKGLYYSLRKRLRIELVMNKNLRIRAARGDIIEADRKRERRIWKRREHLGYHRTLPECFVMIVKRRDKRAPACYFRQPFFVDYVQPRQIYYRSRNSIFFQQLRGFIAFRKHDGPICNNRRVTSFFQYDSLSALEGVTLR